MDEAKTKVETVSKPAVEATPVATTTEVTAVSSKPKKKIALVAAAIALPVVLVLGGLVLVSANRGKDNAFASLSKYLPTEKLPIISNFGPSESETLQESLKQNFSIKELKELGGRETKYTLEANVEGKDAEGNPLNLATKFEGKVALGKDVTTGKMEATLGGKVKAGAVNIDLGEEGFKGDIIIPNQNSFFMSMNLSKSLVDTFGKEISSQLEMAESPYKLEDILGKYVKVDLEKITKLAEEQAGTPSVNVDQVKVQKATEKLMEALRKDVEPLYNKTVGNFEMHSDIKNEGRADVNGQKATIFGITPKNDKVAEAVTELVAGIPAIMRNHRSDFVTFCKEAELDKDADMTCDEMFSEEEVNSVKDLTDSEKSEMKSQLKEALDMIKISNFKMYVNVVDSTVVKSQITIAPSDAALKEINSSLGSKGGLTAMSFTYMFEELSRGKDIQISEPKEYKDLVQILEEQMSKFNELKNMTNPLTNGGDEDASTTNPAEGSFCGGVLTGTSEYEIGMIENGKCVSTEGKVIEME